MSICHQNRVTPRWSVAKPKGDGTCFGGQHRTQSESTPTRGGWTNRQQMKPRAIAGGDLDRRRESQLAVFREGSRPSWNHRKGLELSNRCYLRGLRHSQKRVLLRGALLPVYSNDQHFCWSFFIWPAGFLRSYPPLVELAITRGSCRD